MWTFPLLTIAFGQGGEFGGTALRPAMPSYEVERSLVVGRARFELSLGLDYKESTGAWTNQGEAVEWDGERWLYTTERAAIRYGATRNLEVYGIVPLHYVRMSGLDGNGDASRFGAGDPSLGVAYQLYTRQLPTTSVVLDVAAKLPTGTADAGTYIGGPLGQGTIALSTGQVDIATFVRAKRQAGPFAVVGALGFVYRLATFDDSSLNIGDVVLSGPLKPGSEVRASVSPMVQVGPVALHGDAGYRQWFVASIGPPSGASSPAAGWQDVDESDGWSLDAGGGTSVNVKGWLDIDLSISAPVRGEGLSLFPLESVSATRGVTYATTIGLRW